MGREILTSLEFLKLMKERNEKFRLGNGFWEETEKVER